MGGNASRYGSCFPWRKSRKVRPIKNERTDQRTSAEILEELQSAGFFSSFQTNGGIRVTLKAEKSTIDRTRPRRLPALMSNNRHNEGKLVYDKEEKKLMVEIRRMDILKERGKMARRHSERRQEVLARKTKRMEEKIRRTKEKLRKGQVQNDFKTRPVPQIRS